MTGFSTFQNARYALLEQLLLSLACLNLLPFQRQQNWKIRFEVSHKERPKIFVASMGGVENLKVGNSFHSLYTFPSNRRHLLFLTCRNGFDHLRQDVIFCQPLINLRIRHLFRVGGFRYFISESSLRGQENREKEIRDTLSF